MATSKRSARRRAVASQSNGLVASRTRADDIAEAQAVTGRLSRQLSTAVQGDGAGMGTPPSLAPSTDLTSELNNIDFRKMIGGPLQAAVDAQVASSLATVDFINKIGFSTNASGEKELVMVDFSHKRTDVNAEGETVPTEVFVRVPLLAMLPVPSLRIEHVIVDFNVKLNSVESQATSDALGVNAELRAGWGPVSFKVSASYQRKTSTNVEVRKEYSLNVNVKAVQDEIPAGLERILGMLAA